MLNLSLLIPVVIWYGVWFSYHGILNLFFIPHHISFRKHKVYEIGLAVAFLLIASLIFGVDPYMNNLPISLGILLLVILMDLSFKPVQKTVTKNFLHIRPRSTSPYLTRSADVWFQQIMMAGLVQVLAISALPVSWVFAGLGFGIGHFPVLFMRRLPLPSRLLVLGMASLGGLILAFLIGNIPNGRFWALFLHLGFYYVFALDTGNKDQVIP